MRILFLIRSLNRGGAERQLGYLASGLIARGHEVLVVTMYAAGTMLEELSAQGIPIESLNKTGRWDVAAPVGRLLRRARAFEPDVVHGYMPGANELALLVGRMLRRPAVTGIRASAMNFQHYDAFAGFVFRLSARCSRRAALIIANSEAGRRDHVAHGFSPDRLMVVPNGIDTDRFAPDAAARVRVREAWEVADGQRVVGIAARLDPMKDHPTFLRAAAQIARDHEDAQFVCIGSGADAYEEQLRVLADELGLAARLRWVGESWEMPALLNGLDVLVSSSAFGEGFSNSIAEAMACGVPCAATDVGDARRVIGDTGRIAPAGDPAALAVATGDLLNRAHRLRAAARSRIVEQFSTESLVTQTEHLLASLVEREESAHR